MLLILKQKQIKAVTNEFKPKRGQSQQIIHSFDSKTFRNLIR